MALTLSSRRAPRAAAVTVAGDVDLSIAEEIEYWPVGQTTRDVTVEVDLTAVGFMDSAGSHVLVTARRRADEDAKIFRVTGASRRVRELLDLTGLWDYLSDIGR